MNELTWSDLGEQFDGPHATPKRQSEGPYFLNISSLENGRLDLTKSDRISEDEFVKWTRRVVPQPGDLLYSYETRLGEAALMPAGIKACLGRRMALLRPNRRVVDPRFLLYFYLGPQFQRTIEKHTITGATVPRLLLSEMPRWPVSIPPLPEQRGIAEVLGALDDKIAANSSTSAIADELVRARYGLLKHTAATWRNLGEIAINARLKAPASSVPGDTTYVGLEHVARRRMWLDDFGRADEVSSDKWHFESGDVLFGKLRPYFHKVVSAATEGICSTDILVVRAQSDDLSGLVLAAAADDETVALTTSATEGTRMPRTSWNDLASVPVPWTHDSQMRRFSAWVEVVAQHSSALVTQSQTLAATRDALLPLLMSGKVRVKEAESAVGEVL